jgi:hypothetical protein
MLAVKPLNNKEESRPATAPPLQISHRKGKQRGIAPEHPEEIDGPRGFASHHRNRSTLRGGRNSVAADAVAQDRNQAAFYNERADPGHS